MLYLSASAQPARSPSCGRPVAAKFPARDYPTLKKPIACMGLDYFAARQRVHERYPFYRSTLAERTALFARSSNPTAAARSAAIDWGPAASAAA